MAYAFDHPSPRVSVVIPVFNKLELTRTCLASIHDQGSEASFEIIVVDNGSSDETPQWLAGEQDAGRLRAVGGGQNLGFAKGCNLGAAAARGEYLLFLNNDMKVGPQWLEPLVSTLDQDPAVGIVGAKLLFPDGTIQHGGVALVDVQHGDGPILGGIHLSYGAPQDDPPANKAQRMQVVTGACLLIRREIFRDLGGFDEEYWNGNEDVDLCLKAVEAGWQVVYRPETQIIHYESQSGSERYSQLEPNIQRFQKIWRGRAKPDFTKDSAESFEPTPDNQIGPYVVPRIHLTGPDPDGGGDPRVSIVVLVWNALEYVRQCAESLLANTGDDVELIFVDNGSGLETLEYLTALDGDHARVRVIYNGENLGFAAGNNVGIAAARGQYICLLNSDTVVTDGWLERLVAAAEADPWAGLIGPVTNRITGSQRLPEVSYDQESLSGLQAFAAANAADNPGRREQALWIVGFCVLLKREVVAKIGGLDEGFGRGNYEDTDYCLRAFLAGYKCVVAWDSFVHHFGSRSFIEGRVDYDRELDLKFEIFRTKWGLEATARNTGNLDIMRLVTEGFVPGLHFQPLPASPQLLVRPLPAWEARRWVEQGESFFKEGRLGHAIRMFRAVLRHNPDQDRAANDLAVALWRSDPQGPGKDEAVGLLAGILARDPNHEDARWNLQQIEDEACTIGVNG